MNSNRSAMAYGCGSMSGGSSPFRRKMARAASSPAGIGPSDALLDSDAKSGTMSQTVGSATVRETAAFQVSS